MLQRSKYLECFAFRSMENKKEIARMYNIEILRNGTDTNGM